MRGGALPLTIFATALLAMGAVNWIWTHAIVQTGTLEFAAGVVYLCVAGLIATGRGEAIRPGAPEAGASIRAVPAGSLGAAAMGVAAGTIGLGFIVGTTLIMGGCGLLVGGGLLVGRELLVQRRAALTAGGRADHPGTLR